MSGKTPILLDDESTWPQTVVDLLDGSRDQLAGAQTELTNDIDGFIRDQEIVGYHCTRLATDEILNVQTEGLQPLSAELRQSRVQRRLEAGNITPDTAARLLELGISGDGRHGINCLCFFFTKKIGDWCWKFFRYWGGESIYVSHLFEGGLENDVLRAIGIPCIVEITVPVSAIRYQSVAQGILYEYGGRRGIPLPEASHDVVQKSMRVLRVIEYGSPDFMHRTQNVSWRRPIHP